jgi:hypothetical protein
MTAMNCVGIGLSYPPSSRLHRLAESIPWNRFLGSLKVKNTVSEYYWEMRFFKNIRELSRNGKCIQVESVLVSLFINFSGKNLSAFCVFILFFIKACRIAYIFLAICQMKVENWEDLKQLEELTDSCDNFLTR